MILRLSLFLLLISSPALAEKEPFIARPTAGLITIDGDLGDWWAANPAPIWLGEQTQVKKCNWQGLRDLGGTGFFLYDDKNLYFSAVIYDDRHYQNSTDSGLWNYDSIQMAFDVLGNAAVTGFGDSHLELGFALTSQGPKMECTYRNPHVTKKDLEAIRTAVIRDEILGRTVYEIAIPYPALKPYLAGSKRPIDVCIVVNDSDTGERSWLETGPGVTLSKDPMTFTPVRFDPAENKPALRIFAGLPSLVREDDQSFPFDVLTMNSGSPMAGAGIDLQLAWPDKKITASKKTTVQRGVTLIHFSFPMNQVGGGPVKGTVIIKHNDGKPLATDSFTAVTVKGGEKWCLDQLPTFSARAKALRAQADLCQKAGRHCPKAQIAPAVAEFFIPYIRSIAGDKEKFTRSVACVRQIDWMLGESEKETAMIKDDRLRPAHWPTFREMPDATKSRMKDNVLVSGDRPIFLVGVHGFGAPVRDAKVLSDMGLNIMALSIAQAYEFGKGSDETPGGQEIPHDHMTTGVDKPLTPAGQNFIRQAQRSATENRLAIDWRFIYTKAPFPQHRDPDWDKQMICGWPGNNALCGQDPYTIDYCDREMRQYMEFILKTPGIDSVIGWMLNNEVAMSEKCPRTVEKFHSSLREQYGTLDNLNAAWKSNFTSFSEIKIPEKKETNRAQWYDWWIFHDKTCTDFLVWMMENARLIDPDKTRMFNTKQNQEFGRLDYGFRQGIDQERLFLNDDILGGDSDMNDLGFKLDLYRSLGRGKPFFNDEFHIWFTEDFDAGHPYMYHWQGAIHGQQGAMAWVWSDLEYAAHLIYNMRYRPNVCFQIARAGRDLNRFAEEAVALAKAEGQVAIVYSRAGRIQNDDPYCIDIVKQHALLSKLGLVVEFLSERRLAQGVPERFKAVLLPESTCLPPDSFNGLAEYAGHGGTIILGRGALEKDCRYNDNTKLLDTLPKKQVVKWNEKELAGILKKRGVHVPLFRTRNAESRPVEFRTVRTRNRRLIYLCNMSNDPCKAKIHDAGFQAVDLLTGREYGSQIPLPAWQPMLLETTTPGSDKIFLTLE
jgi:hypothetical protein